MHFIIVNESVVIKRDIIVEKEEEEEVITTPNSYAVFIGKYLLRRRWLVRIKHSEKWNVCP